jgi:hypothetical protein
MDGSQSEKNCAVCPCAYPGNNGGEWWSQC